MKKATKAKPLHAFLLTGVLLAACSNDDGVTEQRNVMEAGKTYYMSIEATKGSDDEAARATRALSLDKDGKLNATWSTNDKVYLRDHDSNLRFTSLLNPSENGSIAWLNGTVTPSATIHNFPIGVTLIFPRKDWSYAGQLGTIENIAAHFDYSIASAEINEIKNNSITSYTSATFEAQQAIVKFTLLDKDNKDSNNNNAALNPSSLRVSASGLKTGEDTTGDITITPSGNTNVIYAALRGITSNTKVTLTATVGNKTYIFNKAGVTFAHGHYYPITVKMHEVTYPVELTAVNNENYIGSVVGTDGKVYAKTSDVPAGQSAVAMIAYVGSGTGLAVALTDESSTSADVSGKTKVANRTWKVPNKQEWKDMIIGCGGEYIGEGDEYTMNCSAFNSKLASVGSALSSYRYRIFNNDSESLFVRDGGVTAEFQTTPPEKVRAVLSF